MNVGDIYAGSGSSGLGNTLDPIGVLANSALKVIFLKILFTVGEKH